MLVVTMLFGCLTDTWEAPEIRPVIEGAPVVGAAEAFLDLPVGTPLGGFSVRCSCLTGQSRQDDRQSNYNTDFVESTGVHTHPTIRVIWIENGDDHLVLTKTDNIYSFDGLVEELERSIGEATGLDLDGKVVHATNHSHSSYGTFSDQITFFSGTDKYNEENFQRMASQITDVAVEAYEGRQDAKIGMSVHTDWDPDDRVYRDRRGENAELVIEGADEPFASGKDPNLVVWRFDTLGDDPLAMIVNFGMHGIILGEDSPMISSDSGGGVEAYLQEQWDEEVVVMFTQGSGGDQSPAGEQDDYARIESVGARAAEVLYDAWAETPTSAQPMRMETASRSIPQHPSQIEVTRNQKVSWKYSAYDDDPFFQADNEIFGADGKLLSPIDEFNTEVGAVFCGTGDLDFPVGKLIGTQAYPYTNCLNVELLGSLISVFFEIDPAEYGLDPQAGEFIPLPLPESLKAGTTATRIGPIAIRDADGTEVSDEVLLGFFPGEPVSMFNEQFRRRAKAELGYDYTMLVGYAQDHEGYLMIPEDWLAGGYEPDISVWGPLQAEWIMEQVFVYVDEVLHTDVHEDPDPLGLYEPTAYLDRPLPTKQPDVTPLAGSRLEAAPEYLWTPLDMPVDLDIPAQVPRVQGQIQMAWEGGDPGADEPVVTLEREVAGLFIPVTSRSGRPITDSYHDILKGYTPDPLYPVDADQTHYWWAGWQAVGHVHDRAGLALGTYRLRVTGTRYVGGDPTWPWTTEPYEVASEPFEVVPGTLALTPDGGGAWVSLPSHPRGYRYISAGGDERGDNPAAGPFTVDVVSPAGTTTLDEVEGGETSAGRIWVDAAIPPGATAITVWDRHGNVGTHTF